MKPLTPQVQSSLFPDKEAFQEFWQPREWPTRVRGACAQIYGKLFPPTEPN